MTDLMAVHHVGFRVSRVACGAGWYEEVLVRMGEFEASDPGSLWHDGSDRHG